MILVDWIKVHDATVERTTRGDQDAYEVYRMPFFSLTEQDRMGQ